MATIDTYAVANFDHSFILGPFGISSDGVTGWYGQQFKSTTNNYTLSSAQFYVSKTHSPTGNAFVRIYNLTGTFGSTAVPTGAALASSDPVDVSTFGTSKSLVTFTFSGANQIFLQINTGYIITIEFSGGDEDNICGIGADISSPTHQGRALNSTNNGASWNTTFGDNGDNDMIFGVFGTEATTTSTTTTTSSSTSSSTSTSHSTTTTTSTSTTTTIPHTFDKPEVEIFSTIEVSLSVQDS